LAFHHSPLQLQPLQPPLLLKELQLQLQMLLVQQLLLASHPLSSLQLSLRMVVVQQQLVLLARQQLLLVLE